MRRILFLLTLAAALPGRAEVPALLAAAVRSYGADANRWAFTQTLHSRDRKGKEQVRVIRFDPSQPDDFQWTLRQRDGRAPTEREQRKFRQEQAERLRKRTPLGQLLDLERATVAEETEAAVTFAVPLRPDASRRLPPEKFQVWVRVDRQCGHFEQVAVRLRSPLRVAVVAKVKSGAAELEFATVDPAYAPVVTRLQADGEGSVLFVRVGGRYTATRTDFQRVTPYHERLRVKLGPLQTLDF